MVWNPSPKVADCREIARKWGNQDQVIILAIDDDGQMQMATYGRTRELCAVAQALGNAAWKAATGHHFLSDFLDIMFLMLPSSDPPPGFLTPLPLADLVSSARFSAAPATHACDAPQVRPHAPQLAGSAVTSMHTLPQPAWPSTQLSTSMRGTTSPIPVETPSVASTTGAPPCITRNRPLALSNSACGSPRAAELLRAALSSLDARAQQRVRYILRALQRGG